MRNGKHSKRFFNRKRKIAILAVALLFLGGGAAFAYFSDNTATTKATVANPATFTIDLDQTPTGGPLTPGGTAETYGWSIYNNTASPMQISGITASVTSDAAGGVLDESQTPPAFNDSCLASWFVATVSNTGFGFPIMLNGNGGLEGPTAASSPNALAVEMLPGPTTNQDACRGVEPQVQMSIQS